MIHTSAKASATEPIKMCSGSALSGIKLCAHAYGVTSFSVYMIGILGQAIFTMTVSAATLSPQPVAEQVHAGVAAQQPTAK